MANLIEEKHRSKSDPSKPPYTAVVDAAGRLGCDCRGWTVHKPGPGAAHEFGRMCTHTKGIVKKYNLKTEQRGDYVFAKNLSAINPVANDEPEPKAAATPKTKKGLPVKSHAKPTVIMHDGIKIIDLDGDELSAYVDPMLASPFPEGNTLENFCASKDIADWAMEEKFDGHRVVFSVRDGEVTAWSRPGVGKEAIKRTPGDPGWPKHLVDDLSKLPNMSGDGEVRIVGGISSDVTDLTRQDELTFVTFDITRLLGEDTTTCTYDERREFLIKIFAKIKLKSVTLAESVVPSIEYVKAIWARDGEGVILKRRKAKYQPGARSRDFIKVKGLESCVMLVTGYKKGKSGPHSTVVLMNPIDGSTTTVKTLDQEALRAFAADPQSFIGRKLRIEYQIRTKDGSYRHPRWDRWENQ